MVFHEHMLWPEFLAFILLLTGFAQSFLHFPVLKAGHLTFMLLTSIIYLFTETLIIFFLSVPA